MVAPVTLSVALCTYNGARFLGEQLQSLVDQTRPPEELVACDDGSTDETMEVLHAFAAAAPFAVRVFRNERTLGSTANFARAISLCTGELIALADQDDVWLPEKLRRGVAALETNPAAGLSFSDALVTDDELRPLGFTLWESAGFDRVARARLAGGDAVGLLLRKQVVTGATAIFRASLRDRVLPIPDGVVHDGWIALLVGAIGELAPIAEPLMLYRQHASNQIGARREGVLTRALNRPGGIPKHLRMAATRSRAAVQRLQDEPAADPHAMAVLRAAQEHLAARTGLPHRVAPRLLAVARELATGRYFRYSNGLYSLAEDLFRR